jgi:hypothetical protein
MRFLNITIVLLVFLMAACGGAQAPADNVAPAGGAAPAAGAAMTAKVEGTLLQVMRGVLFTNSNIIFLTQDTDPTTVKTVFDEKFGNPYGGWTGVENAAIALAEAANLLIIPGRMCGNGKPAPLDQPDWPGFVQGLRDAAQVAYKAAQSKNMDQMVDASGTLTEACAACHDKYREKPDPANRCTP